MSGLTEVQLALRARAIALQVCTTGAVALSVTASGYHRAAGSFLDDGFAPGMEFVGSGFTNGANNGAHVVASVTASDITCPGTVVEAVASRTLTAGLPGTRVYANLEPNTPPARPFVEEDFVPATQTLKGLLSGSPREMTGLYVLRVYGLSNTGDQAVASLADALVDQFAPGLALPLASGRALHVRADTAPWRGQIRQAADTMPARSLAVVTVPFRLLTS